MYVYACGMCACMFRFLSLALCGPLLVQIAASDKGARGTCACMCVSVSESAAMIAAEQQHKKETYSFAICENVNDVPWRPLPAVQISLSKTVNKCT